MIKKVNYGKKHETAFRESAKAIDGLIVERFWDSIGGKMNLKSPSDFIAYKYPNLYYIECKSVAGDTLPLANISEHQWKTLTQRSSVNGCISGILIEYRLTESQNSVVFMDIQYLNTIRNRQGKKYINNDEAKNNGTIIPTKIKKVNWNYDLKSFFHRVL